MAKAIVEQLEFVDVCHNYAKASVVASRTVEFLFQRRFQKTAVIKTGERITDRLVMQLLAQAKVGQPQRGVFSGLLDHRQPRGESCSELSVLMCRIPSVSPSAASGRQTYASGILPLK